MILGKAGVESVFLHLVSFAHALQSPLFLQTAVFYFLNEKIDNKCQKRATVSGQIKQNGEWGALRRDFKLLLLHFFMSCVVWLSGSIKIILLSILFLWKNILWVFTMSSKWQKVKTSQLGPFWVQFCDMNNLNQRLITVERWKAFFSPSAYHVVPALLLPSLPSFPQHCSPAPSLTTALRFIRVPGFHSLSLWHCINWEISYYHGNDFIPRWATPYHLLYLLHRAQCCMQANWFVILKWLLLHYIFLLFKCHVFLSAFSVASEQGLLH